MRLGHSTEDSRQEEEQGGDEESQQQSYPPLVDSEATTDSSSTTAFDGVLPATPRAASLKDDSSPRIDTEKDRNRNTSLRGDRLAERREARKANDHREEEQGSTTAGATGECRSAETKNHWWRRQKDHSQREEQIHQGSSSITAVKGHWGRHQRCATISMRSQTTTTSNESPEPRVLEIKDQWNNRRGRPTPANMQSHAPSPPSLTRQALVVSPPPPPGAFQSRPFAQPVPPGSESSHPRSRPEEDQEPIKHDGANEDDEGLIMGTSCELIVESPLVQGVPLRQSHPSSNQHRQLRNIAIGVIALSTASALAVFVGIWIFLPSSHDVHPDNTSTRVPPTAAPSTESTDIPPSASWFARRRVVSNRSELLQAARDYILNPDDSQQTEYPIEYWNVSAVTDMRQIFSGKAYLPMQTFNSDISRWDVSNVVDMGELFHVATEFNQNLTSWNTSKVTNMNYVFAEAISFQGDVSTWDVSQVQTLIGTFEGAYLFNSDLSKWDVSNVENIEALFRDAKSFNQDLSRWQVGKVTDAMYLFRNTNALETDLSRWDVSCIQYFQRTFSGSKIDSDLSRWNTSSAITMKRMFHRARAFNSDLSRWDVSRVEIMKEMFYGAEVFNASLFTNTHRLIDIEGMFRAAFSFNQPVNLDVSNVNNFKQVFRGAVSFDQDISGWNISKALFTDYMFQNATAFNQDLDRWDVSKVQQMNKMFQRAVSFNGSIGSWQTNNLYEASFMFSGAVSFNRDISQWNVTKLTAATRFMFRANVFSQDLCAWNNVLSNRKVNLTDAWVGTSCPVIEWNTSETRSTLCYDCKGST